MASAAVLAFRSPGPPWEGLLLAFLLWCVAACGAGLFGILSAVGT